MPSSLRIQFPDAFYDPPPEASSQWLLPVGGILPSEVIARNPDIFKKAFRPARLGHFPDDDFPAIATDGYGATRQFQPLGELDRERVPTLEDFRFHREMYPHKMMYRQAGSRHLHWV